jgi:hypothetical protein
MLMRSGVVYANTVHRRNIRPESTHSKNHRLNNLAWNVAYYAKNFHETSNFLNDAAFLTQ